VFPVTVATVHTEPIGPTTQGHTTAVRPGAYAAGLALVLAGLFLIVVYRVAGAVAVVGLLFDLVMTGACLRLWKIAGIHPLLTLSGLIGCGLGIGLVLGSHILLFEYIRSELAGQKGPKVAVAAGYESASRFLLPLHLLALVIALLFFLAGTGPARDWALMLSAGSVASLLTVFLATRTLLKTVTEEWNLSRLSV
ncbi:MAG: hypothetical protein HY710_06810, partial [Candidatus Latescibacteria bacterium]|nr:hypothetical protein [Candidatus Latescibacterota bacterium]